jgi:hypothetical protein
MQPPLSIIDCDNPSFDTNTLRSFPKTKTKPKEAFETKLTIFYFNLFVEVNASIRPRLLGENFAGPRNNTSRQSPDVHISMNCEYRNLNDEIQAMSLFCRDGITALNSFAGS